MRTDRKSSDALVAENSELRLRLREAEEALDAIRSGEVDALVISRDGGKRIFTLQGAEQPYRTMIERMSEGAAVLTGDGTVLYCNSRFSEMLEEPMERIIGKDPFPFILPEDRSCFSKHLAQAQTETARAEIRLQGRSGKLVPVQVAVSRLETEEAQRVCLVATDLTEYKLNAEKRREAEAAAQARDDFIAILSHELRNPLAPVLIASGDCEIDSALSPELRSIFRMIRTNIELEARLIDDLLEITRIRRGKLQVKLESIDLHLVIDQSIAAVRPDFLDRKLQLISELNAERHHIRGDAARLTQVFWNLLRNALKFTDSGTVCIRTRNKGERIQVEIVDTGIGIESHALVKIFDPFAQEESRGEHRLGGLGLGLAIAKALVEMHEGTITAYSAGKGKGATFTVELATTDEIAEQPTRPTASEPPKEIFCKVLLVDDHADTLQTLSRILRRWGYDLHTATGVKDALQLVEKQPFDLIVSDLGLPDGSGSDIMRVAKERYGLRGIALSGYGTEADIRQSLAAGFDEHLVKPVSSDALRAAIQRAMSERARAER